MRQLKRLPPNAVWLFEDETILRLLPELRRAWSLRGEQARIPITGQNAKCVLFGTINPRTGHRIVARSPSLRQAYFQKFLSLLRQSYPGRQIRLILDKASSHTAPGSRILARSLGIILLWLPKQWSELNGMDQLWRGLKTQISANAQFNHVHEHATFAQQWIASLSKTEALRKAGILSKGFWLKSFLP